MSWNYRVIERIYQCPTMQENKESFSIEEVYYDEETGEPKGWTKNCRCLSCYEDNESLLIEIDRIKKAFNKSVLKIYSKIDNTEELYRSPSEIKLSDLEIFSSANAPSGPRFELYLDSLKKWRWRLKAMNGQIIAVGESYLNKNAALNAIIQVKKAIKNEMEIKEIL